MAATLAVVAAAVSELLLPELSELPELEEDSTAGLLSGVDFSDSAAPFWLPFSAGGLGRP